MRPSVFVAWGECCADQVHVFPSLVDEDEIGRHARVHVDAAFVLMFHHARYDEELFVANGSYCVLHIGSRDAQEVALSRRIDCGHAFGDKPRRRSHRPK